MLIFAFKESSMKKSFAAIGAALVLALSLQAQNQPALTPSDSIPVPDGVVRAGEYQYSAVNSGMTLGATLGSDDKLYLSIQAATEGWVALGIGGTLMNDSRLFLAYDTGSKQVFNEQLGAGHTHGDVADPLVSKWAVREAGGATTLELALPASVAIADGKLELLFAYADTTSYAAHHKARGSLIIPVQD
jgi:hypothetical protein